MDNINFELSADLVSEPPLSFLSSSSPLAPSPGVSGPPSSLSLAAMSSTFPPHEDLAAGGTSDAIRITSGAIHSILGALGVSFNLLVLLINWFECRPSRRSGITMTVNIGFLATSDMFYSLMSCYYAVATYLDDHNFLGAWSCRMNGLDITLMHINIWGTLAIGLQRKAAVRSGTEYRSLFTLRTTLFIVNDHLTPSSPLTVYQLFEDGKSAMSFNIFIIAVYFVCYLVPVVSIASFYKTFGHYFREQIRSSRRRATFNCPRSASQRYADDRNRFMHFYAYATAITVFICYTPFFNYRLLVALDVMLFKQTILKMTSSWLPVVESVAVAICALNSVANPFFYILLKHMLAPSTALAYHHQHPPPPTTYPSAGASNGGGGGRGENKPSSSVCLQFGGGSQEPDKWPPTKEQQKASSGYHSHKSSKKTGGGGGAKNKEKIYYTVTVQKTGRLYRSEAQIDLSDI
ncbi:uncharacterized protein LOC142353360 [Convolutriloba macropyga]|uniref:uncharacterized protein LOC142353360 n=1 Tax=Convolutriloba macropyga TaxID=536237 RepID=UPI003F51DC5E